MAQEGIELATWLASPIRVVSALASQSFPKKLAHQLLWSNFLYIVKGRRFHSALSISCTYKKTTLLTECGYFAQEGTRTLMP